MATDVCIHRCTRKRVDVLSHFYSNIYVMILTDGVMTNDLFESFSTLLHSLILVDKV